MTGSGPRVDLPQVPHRETARRIDWPFLPRALREAVEGRLGSPVTDASSRDSGYTPGFASVLTGTDGRTVFVKSASRVAQPDQARTLEAEVARLSALPPGVPAPRVLWTLDVEDWVTVGFAAYAGRPPARPWVDAELERALDLVEQIAEATDPVPAGLRLEPLLTEMPVLATAWVRAPKRSLHDRHRDEAIDLASDYADLPATAFAHTDLRDDNVLLGDDGSAIAVDWSWCSLAQPWQDTVDLLVSAYGDGVDVETVLRRRRLTRDVDPAHIDSWLSASAGFMELAGSRRAPMNSPFLGTHSRWYAAALWGWLSERRGWA